MPFKKNAVVATIATALATTLLGVANAAAACPTQTSSQVFKQFGDTSQYALAPNGTFQNNAAGWTFTGSVKVIKDTSPYNLSGSGAYALQLGAGATATSPAFCVSAANPSFRYLLLSSPLSVLASNVEYLPANLAGFIPLYSWSFVSPNGTAWTPSARNPLSTLLPLNVVGATASVRLEFVSGATPLTISDVYVDPWAR